MNKATEQEAAQPPKVMSSDEREFAAAANSMAHHSLIMQGFASHFVYIFAVFNIGAFSATIALVPTAYGQKVMTDQMGPAVVALSLFAAGFVSAACLMGMLFQYSHGKYRYYRSRMRGETGAAFVENIKLHVASYFFLAFTVLFAFAGILCVLWIVTHVVLPPPQTGP